MAGDESEMRGTLRISAEVMAQMLTGLKSGEDERVYRVVKNGLPDDAKLISTGLSYDRQTIELTIEANHLETTNGRLPDVWLESVSVKK